VLSFQGLELGFTAVANVLVAEISGVVADLDAHDVQLVVHEKSVLGIALEIFDFNFGMQVV
jgi:hypothetical protein